MFSFLKKTVVNLFSGIKSKLCSLFSKPINKNSLIELKTILLEADVGIKLANELTIKLEQWMQKTSNQSGSEARTFLEAQLLQILEKLPKSKTRSPEVLLLLGINGSGKTTTAAKLAHRFAQQGKKTLLVAADTFRMTAVEQLEEWAKTANVHFHRGSPNQDPASVAYQGCKRWRDENFDHVIIDTAGRLHTQANLINELAKIRRVVAKNVSEEKICSWLTLDSMLGQSSFAQAKLFGEALPLDGLLLTKFDGTGKAGTVFAIASQLKLPIPFITHGEEIDAIKQFDAKQYVHDLLYE